MSRVLVFRNDLLPLSETFIRQQVIGLRDWQATLIGHRRLSPGLDLSGLPVSVVEPPRTPLQRLRWRLYSRTGSFMPATVRALLEPPPALIHAHFGVDAVAGWPWLRHLGVPMLVTLHGYDVNVHPAWWEAGHGDGYAAGGMRRYPARLRALARDPRVSFVAVSQAIKQRAVDAYGVAPAKIEVLHIGVDHNAFAPGPVPVGSRPPRVLFVGRLVEKKAPAVLIRAMQQVQAHVPAAELVLIGDGPLRQASEQLAVELKVNARFMGSQPSSAVRQALDEARVFCLPSITAENGDAEGLPISILEAQACGVPVVTSAVGGRDEGIQVGGTGFAFAEGDPVALAGHLQRLLTDDAEATRMGQQATRFVADHFSLAQCTRALEAHYDRVAKAATA